jgi:hypothetical protein
MAKTEPAKTAVDVRDTAIHDDPELAEEAPLNTAPLREDMPTNDEPDIPMTAGAEDIFSEPVQKPPAVVQAPRVVEAPRRPDPVEAPLNRRIVTDADVASPGFKLLSSHAQDNAELLILRPGDRVLAGVEVIGMTHPDDRMELRPGAVVPEGDIGYLPTNYIKDHARQRIMHQDAERSAGNR